MPVKRASMAKWDKFVRALLKKTHNVLLTRAA
jgi:hypothetical protein